MDKKAVEKSYQDGVELIQNYVSDYLVKNYEGIEKIEWQGIGVEWRSSPVFGSSMFGNYVNSYVNVFVSEKTFIKIEYRLNDETEYNDDLQKYIASDSLNPDNVDFLVDTGIENAIYEYSDNPDSEKMKVSEDEKLDLEKVKKSVKGSPNVQIIYNLEIHELTY